MNAQHKLRAFQSLAKHPLKTSALALLSLCPALPSMAAEQQTRPWVWGIGIGAVSSQKPYADIDRSSMAIPMLFLENKYIRVLGLGVDVKLPTFQLSDSQRLNFYISGKYDGSGYDDDDIKDTPILNGMHERDSGFLLGLKVEWETALLNVNAAWLADVTGSSEGQRISLGIDKSWQIKPQIVVTPYLSATFLDSSYVDYYYGVLQSEMRSDRPAYKADSAVQFEFGVRSMYLFNAKHSAFIDVGVTSLSAEIKDSPLVDRSTIDHILLGYTYRF
jgi:outer membrane protein